jgi:endonuclease YncB( thermonuclease family)
MRRLCFIAPAALGLGLMILGASGVQGKSAYLAGPVLGFLEQVIDGDTIRARALIWLRQEVRITIRLNGVDTPELHGRCAEEIAMAHQARRFTARWLSGGPIKLTRIRQGKYGGRVIAKIANARGQDLGRALLREGLARPYSGAKRKSWCQNKPGRQKAHHQS